MYRASRILNSLKLPLVFFLVFSFWEISHNVSWAQQNMKPRFVSFAKNKTNMRVGPGLDFPIKWEYRKKNIPVLLIAEFRNWRQIIDFEGEKGWVHKALLKNNQSFIVKTNKQALYSSANKNSVLAFMTYGVTGTLERCKENWCKVVVNDLSGWVQTKHIWGHCIPIDPTYKNIDIC